MKKSLWYSISFVGIVLLWLAFTTPLNHQKTKKLIPGAYEGMSSFWESRNILEPSQQSRFFKAFEYAKNMRKAESAWESMGPTNWGGRTLALAIDPTDVNRIYAGSASGGLWISDSQGMGDNAWRKVHTGYPVLGVGTIAIDPENSNILFIGTGEVYSYQTGMPGVGQRITRGSYGIGVLKSTDRGETWEPSLDWRYQNQNGVQAIVFEPGNSQILWAATTEGTYKSLDRGATWSKMLDVVMATDLVIHSEDPDRVIVSCGGMGSPGAGIYRTENGGVSFEKMDINHSYGGKALLDSIASQPNQVFASLGSHPYASQTESHLIRSDDFGEHWVTVNSTDYAKYQGWYAHFASINPNQPTQLLVGGVDLYKSNNRGNLLTKIKPVFNNEEPSNLGWADHHAIAFHPENPKVWYIACDQGIFRTEDSGNTFTRCVSGYQTSQFYNGMAQSQNNRNLFAGSVQDWYGFRYTGTDHWELEDRVFEGGWIAYHPTDDQVQYHCAYYLNMLRYDHGSIEDITPTGSGSTSFSAPFVLAPSNPNTIYGGRDRVYKSSDRGDHWIEASPVFTGAPTISMGISTQDDQKVFTTTIPVNSPSFSAVASIWRTVDGGDQWDDISGNLPDRFFQDIVVDPNDDSRIYVVASGFGSSHVFGSLDGGDTWQDLDEGRLPDLPTSALTIDPDFPDHIYVGNDLGVYFSPNRGQDWYSLNEGLPDAVLVMDLKIYGPDRLLRMGTHGNGAYEMPLVGVSEGTQSLYVYALPAFQCSEQENMLIGVINPNSASLLQDQVEIIGYSSSGMELGRKNMALNSGQKVMLSPEELFSCETLNWVMIGSDASLIIYVETFSELTRSAAWASLAGEPSLVVPHLAKDTTHFETEMFFSHRVRQPATVEMSLFPGNGQIEIESLNSPYSQSSYLARNLLQENLQNTDWLKIQSNGGQIFGVEAFRMLPRRNGEARLGLLNQSNRLLRFLHVAKDTANYWSGIVYLNPSDEAVSVTERYYDQNGQLLRQMERDLHGMQKQTLLFDAQTLTSGEYPSEVAWLEVLGSDELIGYELFGTPSTAIQQVFAGLHAGYEPSDRLIFPHFTASDLSWTGWVLVNSGQEELTFTVRICDSEGGTVQEVGTQTLLGHQKLTLLSADLLDEALWPQAAWMEIQANQPNLMGFQLWGDHGASREWLAGLGAAVMN